MFAFLHNSSFGAGAVIGFLASIPVGPVCILCIRRTLSNGFFSGFTSGLAAATVDGIYAIFALFSLTFVSAIFEHYFFWIKLLCGIFLLYFGYSIFSTPPVLAGAVKRKNSLITDYVSAFFVTSANPISIFAFAAFFAGFGFGQNQSYFFTSRLIAGVMVGASLWWLLVTGLTALFRKRFNQRALQLINTISGVGIALFGLAALLSIV